LHTRLPHPPAATHPLSRLSHGLHWSGAMSLGHLGPPHPAAPATLGLPDRLSTSPPAVLVCHPDHLAVPRAWAATSSSYGRRLLELGSSSPSTAALALPAAPSTSASPTVKSHWSVALATCPICCSCASLCHRLPVLLSAFTGRRPAVLLLAGRPEVPIESRGEDFVLLLLLHLR
jgi:hypothetical protein